MQKDRERREGIREKLNENGGFLDKNMHTFELTETKVINDLCNKF